MGSSRSGGKNTSQRADRTEETAAMAEMCSSVWTRAANTLLAFRYKRKFVADRTAETAAARNFTARTARMSLYPGTARNDPHAMWNPGRSSTTWPDGRGFRTLSRRPRRMGKQVISLRLPARYPRFAKAGLPGEEREVVLELKMIADVGLAGLPSAGQVVPARRLCPPPVRRSRITTSRRWSRTSAWYRPAANPGFVMADIPGLIEGASEGRGSRSQLPADTSNAAVCSFRWWTYPGQEGTNSA